MSTPPIPKNLTDTVSELLAHGWTFALEQGADSGGSAYVRIQARKMAGAEPLVTTWHSRETGGERYRWRHGQRGGRTIQTLAKVRDIIVGESA